MKLRWAALLMVLALVGFRPRVLQGQATSQPPTRGEAQVELGSNYPNPFTTETRIPFALGDVPQCSEPSRLYRVSLRVYNILSQLVAVPVLQGGSGSVPDGQPLDNVMLPCSRYVGFWDGHAVDDNRQVSPGVYIYRLEVDGKAYVHKMTLRP